MKNLLSKQFKTQKHVNSSELVKNSNMKRFRCKQKYVCAFKTIVWTLSLRPS